VDTHRPILALPSLDRQDRKPAATRAAGVSTEAAPAVPPPVPPVEVGRNGDTP
jgi:hypothetical protein